MELSQIIRILTVILIMAMMVAIGLRTEFGQVVATLRQPRLVLRSVAANFVLVPLAAVGLQYLFPAESLVAAGFLVLSVCAGAPLGPVAAVIAKGDVPLSVGLMVTLAVLSAVFSPVLLALLLSPVVTAADIRVDLPHIVQTLIFAQILPLGLGLAARRWWPARAERVARPLLTLSNVILLAVILMIGATQFRDARVFSRATGIGLVVLPILSLVSGWVCGGPGMAARKTLALTTGIRNTAMALVIVTVNFSGTNAVTTVAAYGIVSIVGGLACAGGMRRVESREE